ncbi:MAG TPA: efflux RND transporter periplasmic adaptor subunit [Candidatus Binatia bacterium]|jgi:HlyD family secretion protein
MNRFALALLYIAAGLAALFNFSACKGSDGDSVQGYVEGEFVYVASALPGALGSLYVRRGAQVKAGDPLFELDDAAEKAQRDQVRAALMLSEREFERLEKLARANLIAMADLDRARAARDQDRERLAKAEWELSQKRQSAPQAGLVFDTFYRPGEWVAAGRPVVAILPPENTKVRAFVPEARVAMIHPGDKVRVTVDGLAEPVAGKISFISPKAEYTPPVIYSRDMRDKLVFLVELAFDPAVAAKLHPGQPVDVQFGS